MIKPNEHTIIDLCNKKIDDSINKDIELYFCGSQVCPPSHYRTGVRDYYLIHYITSGSGDFKANGKSFNLGKGDGFLICPHDTTTYIADKKNPWSYQWLAFHGTKAEHFISQVGLSKDKPIFSYTDDDCLKELLEKMEVVYKKEGINDFYQLSLLYKLFYVLMAHRKEEIVPINKQDRTKKHLAKAVEFIGKNYSRKTSIEEMARYTGVSRKYLHATFVNQLGISPQQCLLQYRMEKACELISRNQLTVSEVAQSVGYEDPYLFSRMFKRLKGVAPSFWNRKIYAE